MDPEWTYTTLPRELSEQLLDKSINPDKIPQFTNKKVFKKYNIVIYDVKSSRKGQQASKRCHQCPIWHIQKPLVYHTSQGRSPEDSYISWRYYNKIQRRIAFLNGKALAFSANNSPEEVWWDMEDQEHDGIPIPPRKEGDVTITEKINHAGVTIEIKKEYKTGKSLLQSFWPNGNPKKK